MLFENGAVAGVATGDMGVGKDGENKASFTRGMELRAKYTLFAEGARGNLSKMLIERFALHQNGQPQKYGIGLKELWQVTPQNFRKGLVQHTMGWPLANNTGGGSFLYHYGDNLVSVGFVVHLNYQNPYLSPFEEFQRFKTHPLVRDTFAGGKRICYGARALTEGGWQSVPKLAFAGGALIGCAAGFMNVPRIKGSHNAMLSGMLAAEHVATALAAGRAHDELSDYDAAWRGSPIGHRSLAGAKCQAAVVEAWNICRCGARWRSTCGPTRSAFRCSARSSTASPILRRLSRRLTAGRSPIRSRTANSPSTGSPRSICPTPTTRRTSRSHLIVRDPALQKSSEHDVYAGPSARYCPAGVYEWVEEGGQPRYVINAQNCVHCKTCDIKDPNQNINWVPPEGGGGPELSEYVIVAAPVPSTASI